METMHENIETPAQRLEKVRHLLEHTAIDIEVAQRELATTLEKIKVYRDRRSVLPPEATLSLDSLTDPHTIEETHSPVDEILEIKSSIFENKNVDIQTTDIADDFSDK